MPEDNTARLARLEAMQTAAHRQVKALNSDLARARAKGQGKVIERIKASIKDYETEIEARAGRIARIKAESDG